MESVWTLVGTPTRAALAVGRRPGDAPRCTVDVIGAPDKRRARRGGRSVAGGRAVGGTIRRAAGASLRPLSVDLSTTANDNKHYVTIPSDIGHLRAKHCQHAARIARSRPSTSPASLTDRQDHASPTPSAPAHAPSGPAVAYSAYGARGFARRGLVGGDVGRTVRAMNAKGRDSGPFLYELLPLRYAGIYIYNFKE